MRAGTLRAGLPQDAPRVAIAAADQHADLRAGLFNRALAELGFLRFKPAGAAGHTASASDCTAGGNPVAIPRSSIARWARERRILRWLGMARRVALGVSGGIAVDAGMRTRVEGVWAAGDCVESVHRLSGQRVVVALGGPLQAIPDRFGNVITITRLVNKFGNIAKITAPHGRYVEFTYDTSDRITQATDNSVSLNAFRF